MQLATSRDGQPWLCNVWYVMDEASGKIYWISRETRRHSEEIEHNNKVACTFHQWFGEGLGQKGQALIIAGTARRLSGAACDKPFDLYQARYPGLAGFQSKEDFLTDKGDHYFYEITPTEIIWWDEENFPEQSRQKIL